LLGLRICKAATAIRVPTVRLISCLEKYGLEDLRFFKPNQSDNSSNSPVCEKDVRIMPPIFPIIAIVAVFVFISTHAAVSPPPKKEKSKSPSSDLAKALEEVIQASSKAKGE
jgi:hypothetical protein